MCTTRALHGHFGRCGGGRCGVCGASDDALATRRCAVLSALGVHRCTVSVYACVCTRSAPAFRASLRFRLNILSVASNNLPTSALETETDVTHSILPLSSLRRAPQLVNVLAEPTPSPSDHADAIRPLSRAGCSTARPFTLSSTYVADTNGLAFYVMLC